MSDQEKPKKGFPGSFLIFLLVAVLIALTVQNFLGAKHANVSFSYQVQHLANLQLIVPQDSRMTALNDNLVTFSGKFRDNATEAGKKRFKYLSLLDQEDRLRDSQRLFSDELKQDRKAATSAAEWFLQLTGVQIPEGGFRVFGVSAAAPVGAGPLVIKNLPKREVVSLAELKSQLSNLRSEQEIKAFGSNLALLIQNFRSPALGIGQEKMKQTLRKIDSDVTKTGTMPIYENAISELEGITSALLTPKQGVVLTQLRSVRNTQDTLREYEATTVEIEGLDLQLSKAREPVSSVIWFYNNEELSSRALERENPEHYNQWFQQAKQEWENFPVNKGLAFRAVDQPRNTVLERTFKSEAPAPNFFRYLPIILLVGLLLMILYFIFSRQMKGGMGNSAMSFGKSPAKMLGKGMSDVTFDDVAGCDEAKEELQEIVDFLKSPGKFTALGGRIPKGVLCVGPPGTGKTLIAKAVAGEANRPFFSISGSDFVEMFVGVGASRIRDLFTQAKKQSPCIIFIDEIDAVGRHRGGGHGGGHDEREQTLNQLLVEMDGFDTNEGVILMAATNRPDVLDTALLRPGRFDRRVVIDLPDIKGRYQILKVHARKIKIDPSVDLMAIARMTPGSSGADLGNLLNEAALLAARKGRSAVTAADTLEAADKVRYGKERRSLEITEEEKRTTAYHESGHAIVGYLCEKSDPVDKVTVIPRGFSLGATHFLPTKNRLSYWKQELIDQLAVAMGGRVAEEIFVGDISSGAQQDISQATNIARNMVTQWGMSEKLGLVSYGERSDSGQFLGFGGSPAKNYSEAKAEEIDEDVRKLCEDAHQRARNIIEANRDKMECMTEALMEFETIDREDIEKIMADKWSPDEKREKMKNIDTLHKKQEPDPAPIANELNPEAT